MPRGQYPRTAEQWQIAVDGAQACLYIDSVRQYGLIEGGPEVNVAKCEDLLARGKARGFTPAADCLEQFVAAWNEQSGHAERRPGAS